MAGIIALVGCLDSKGSEIEYAKGIIEKNNLKALLIDTSVLHKPTICPDITSEEVIKEINLPWDELIKNKKSKAIALMTEAVTMKLKNLYSEGRFDGVISMGGGQNTQIATTAMKNLPLGVPKIMVSTIACGNRTFEPFIGTTDIIIMHSVADISGLNSITKLVINNAVSSMVGMINSLSNISLERKDKISVGASMIGITSEGVQNAARIVEEKGYDVIAFHGNGVGGYAMEELVQNGKIKATLDMTLHEIVAELYGGYCFCGRHGRLMEASTLGIPQVIVPGAADVISIFSDLKLNQLSYDLKARKCYNHNDTVIHVKLNNKEIKKVAEKVCERLNISIGPLTVIIPLRGFCKESAPGGLTFDPDIDLEFIYTLKKGLKKDIKILEIDKNINDYECSRLAAEELLNYFN